MSRAPQRPREQTIIPQLARLADPPLFKGAINAVPSSIVGHFQQPDSFFPVKQNHPKHASPTHTLESPTMSIAPFQPIWKATNRRTTPRAA